MLCAKQSIDADGAAPSDAEDDAIAVPRHSVAKVIVNRFIKPTAMEKCEIDSSNIHGWKLEPVARNYERRYDNDECKHRAMIIQLLAVLQ